MVIHGSSLITETKTQQKEYANVVLVPTRSLPISISLQLVPFVTHWMRSFSLYFFYPVLFKYLNWKFFTFHSWIVFAKLQCRRCWLVWWCCARYTVPPRRAGRCCKWHQRWINAFIHNMSQICNGNGHACTRAYATTWAIQLLSLVDGLYVEKCAIRVTVDGIDLEAWSFAFRFEEWNMEKRGFFLARVDVILIRCWLVGAKISSWEFLLLKLTFKCKL